MAQGGWAQQTSAGPAPGVTFGGFWIRFVALIIDAIILGVVIGILSSVSASLIYVGWIAELAYLVVCWGVLGQTIGMMPF
jgi:hypothetical protein